MNPSRAFSSFGSTTLLVPSVPSVPSQCDLCGEVTSLQDHCALLLSLGLAVDEAITPPPPPPPLAPEWIPPSPPPPSSLPADPWIAVDDAVNDAKHSAGRYRCKECRKWLSSKTALRRHYATLHVPIIREHLAEDGLWPCASCGIHTYICVRVLNCCLCVWELRACLSSSVGKRYQSKSSLIRHQDRHDTSCLVLVFEHITRNHNKPSSQVDALLISPALAAIEADPSPIDVDPANVCILITCPWHDVQMGGRHQFEVKTILLFAAHHRLSCSLTAA
jgi:hypothetical protein